MAERQFYLGRLFDTKTDQVTTRMCYMTLPT